DTPFPIHLWASRRLSRRLCHARQSDWIDSDRADLHSPGKVKPSTEYFSDRRRPRLSADFCHQRHPRRSAHANLARLRPQKIWKRKETRSERNMNVCTCYSRGSRLALAGFCERETKNQVVFIQYNLGNDDQQSRRKYY